MKKIHSQRRRNASPARGRKAKLAPKRRDSLDEFILAGARALNLKIARAWMPAVRTHLEITLDHGTLVASEVLPDDAEPAPVFKA